MKSKYFNMISVHCWGGLGSQLFAWALAEQLLVKFPNKRIRMVFHTSGVTKRYPEIDFLSSRFDLVYENDFEKKATTMDYKRKNRPLFKGILKQMLDYLRIINTSEKSTRISQIMPWTFSVRGHYSNNYIPLEILQMMKSEIIKFYGSAKKVTDNYFDTLGIHYRLGDLLHIENKTFIAADKIGLVAKSVSQNQKIKKVFVYSDTIEESKNYLKIFLPIDTEYVNTSIWETLIELSRYKFFVGSNSKISVWIIFFQQLQNPNFESWLPKTMSKNINQKFYGLFNFQNINLY